MRFDDFDKEMRQFETALDQTIPPEVFMIVRLDGIAFTNLVDRSQLRHPFDDRFRRWMSETTARLFLRSGFRIIYAETHSDEISLLIHPKDDTYNRKVRKILSSLAGRTSSIFSRVAGNTINAPWDEREYQEYQDSAFDARISVLPNLERVIDYFRWRMEDSRRNCLSAYLYWNDRERGLSPKEADWMSMGLNWEQRIQRLTNEFGIIYHELPSWQRRGVGFVKGRPGEVHMNAFLPSGDGYAKYLEETVNRETFEEPREGDPSP